MKQHKRARDPRNFQKTVAAGIALLLVVTMVISLVATMAAYR